MTFKLFIWEDVLCDYTCGIAVAMAHDVDEAREVLLDVARNRHWDQSTALGGSIAKKPDKIYDVPAAAFCWGGG